MSPYHALTAMGALPLLALAVLPYLLAAGAVNRLVHRGNAAAAIITGALVEREFEHWVATLESHAGFPALSGAVAAGDEDAVRARLAVFVGAHPRVDRAFVTDTTGLLWVDSPVAPESLGRRFDERDWFRGVSLAGEPYVSEVYQRAAEPRLLVVAVAVPVLDPSTRGIAGFLVGQVTVPGLSELLGRVEIGEDGIVLLLDHQGAVVAHPTVGIEGRIYRGYAGLLPEVRGGEDLRVVRIEYRDPLSGDAMLASAVPIRVGSHRWTVVAQQPRGAAFAATRALAGWLGVAGLLLAALVGWLLWGLGRENRRRQAAEEALKAANLDLERRVEERTAELRQKEEEFLQAQKMEAMGRLAGGVAHDFNNLLTVILALSELARERYEPDAPERVELDEIRSAGERAADLTRQLLAFSRKQVIEPKVLDVNEAVESMRGILERVLGADVDLACHLAPELHPVRFDPGQIEQVILNLAVNARDAMPQGGRLTVETANVDLDRGYVREHPDAQTGPHVMLAVSDSGFGMDAETRKRIFEPFFTTKRLGRGTGLGLSTVYGIVRQGGGNIWVYSEPGRGTTFKVYLPRTNEAPGEPEVEPTRPLEAGTGTILVVEDDSSVRALLARILREGGYDVFTASDAKGARAAVDDHAGAVDLLLTDVVLPDLGGPGLAAELQAKREGLRVLYTSGYTDDAIVHHGILEGGTPFIQKPLRPAAVLRKVREVLGR